MDLGHQDDHDGDDDKLLLLQQKVPKPALSEHSSTTSNDNHNSGVLAMLMRQRRIICNDSPPPFSVQMPPASLCTTPCSTTNNVLKNIVDIQDNHMMNVDNIEDEDEDEEEDDDYREAANDSQALVQSVVGIGSDIQPAELMELEGNEVVQLDGDISEDITRFESPNDGSNYHLNYSPNYQHHYQNQGLIPVTNCQTTVPVAYYSTGLDSGRRWPRTESQLDAPSIGVGIQRLEVPPHQSSSGKRFELCNDHSGRMGTPAQASRVHSIHVPNLKM